MNRDTSHNEGLIVAQGGCIDVKHSWPGSFKSSFRFSCLVKQIKISIRLKCCNCEFYGHSAIWQRRLCTSAWILQFNPINNVFSDQLRLKVDIKLIVLKSACKKCCRIFRKTSKSFFFRKYQHQLFALHLLLISSNCEIVMCMSMNKKAKLYNFLWLQNLNNSAFIGNIIIQQKVFPSLDLCPHFESIAMC